MEHVELAGIHSGDSACYIPAPGLSTEAKDTIRKQTFAMAKDLQVCGLMNVQFAVQDGVVYVLEVNPRASRTVPFVSKAIGVPLAKLAALVMAGHKLKDLGFTKEVQTKHCSVKEAVFPFSRFPGIDLSLSLLPNPVSAAGYLIPVKLFRINLADPAPVAVACRSNRNQRMKVSKKEPFS